MKRIFFVVATGGHDTDTHYHDTIENKRSLSEVKDFLTKDQFSELERLY